MYFFTPERMRYEEVQTVCAKKLFEEILLYRGRSGSWRKDMGQGKETFFIFYGYKTS